MIQNGAKLPRRSDTFKYKFNNEEPIVKIESSCIVVELDPDEISSLVVLLVHCTKALVLQACLHVSTIVSGLFRRVGLLSQSPSFLTPGIFCASLAVKGVVVGKGTLTGLWDVIVTALKG